MPPKYHSVKHFAVFDGYEDTEIGPKKKYKPLCGSFRIKTLPLFVFNIQEVTCVRCLNLFNILEEEKKNGKQHS